MNSVMDLQELTLVTGGGGFLGEAVVRQLLARGERVRTFSRSRYPQLSALPVDQVQGDLADADAVSRAVAGVSAVIHCAAKPGVFGPYQSFYRTNVLGTELLLKACRAHGVRSLVYTSSPSVTFGGTDQDGVDETTPYPAHYVAHYPRTKAMGEKAVLAANGPSLQTVSLRPHLIWGPGDQHLLPRLIARARSGRLRIIGDGHKLVDAVYIDNAAAAHLLALDSLRRSGFASPAAGKVYYISNDEPWAVKTLINGMLAAAKLPPVEKHIPVWLGVLLGDLFEATYRVMRKPGEPALTRFIAKQLTTSHWYRIDAAKRDLGYHPDVSMQVGMQRLAKHFEVIA